MLSDEIDSKIIGQLMQQGRITWSELAQMLGLSAPAAADRVRRLEERGVIQGYSAQIDPSAVGCELTAFITVKLADGRQRAAFLAKIQDLPEVQECHHVTGESDYWLKIRCRHTRDLERLISDHLKAIKGVSTSTTIVLSTAKETAAVPIYDGR